MWLYINWWYNYMKSMHNKTVCIIDGTCSSCFNISASGRCKSYFQYVTSDHVLWMKFMRNFCEIYLRWIQKSPGMISQHWLNLWLGAVRQQNFTWPNVDPNLCLHMAPWGHNGLPQLHEWQSNDQPSCLCVMEVNLRAFVSIDCS